MAGFGPQYAVSASRLNEGEGNWNRDGSFLVRVAENVTIRILAESATDQVAKEGMHEVTLQIPDGKWTVTYWVDDRKWHTYHDVWVDSTPPRIVGLETVATASDERTYILGEGATVTDAVSLTVLELPGRRVLGRTLPVELSGLADGLQAYLVSARDEAGNYANATVQVHVGTAANLPPGKYTFGVVARYTNDVRLWDLTHPEKYLSRAAARAAAGEEFLGDGFGVTPEDSAVQEVVAEVVTPEMNTVQAALALYKWFSDELDYDETRLDSDTLLTPHQVILDTEAADGASTKTEGLVDDGAGNSVHGGICRDLAGTFVSLLRASGIPARLVSGYVAGTVDGFHAWVEFYAGPIPGADGKAQSPWMPVDVSTIDGPYREQVMLQSFGIKLPDYLPLRSVPAADEVEGWSTALSVHYTWPQGTGAASPKIEFRKDLTSDFSYSGVLCFNAKTNARRLADDTNACGTGYDAAFPDFVRQTSRTIDYGIDVVSAPKGTRVVAEVAYPFQSDVEPDQVVYQFYGTAVEDQRQGKAVSTFDAPVA